MKVRRTKQQNQLVIWVTMGVMLLGMGVLISELWQLQVPMKDGFEKVFRNQSVRRVRLPAVRGKICDTHGEVLADSVPNYCIAIFTEELRAPRSVSANTLALMHEVWARVGRRPNIGYHDILRHLEQTPNAPLVLYDNLSDVELARWQAAFGRWSEKHRIPGLKTHEPLRDNHISIETKELLDRSTTTAANTLELVYNISNRIGIPRAVTYQQIKDHIYARRPLPLLAWKNIDDRIMARWADTCSGLIGTDIYYLPARTYTHGDLFAHLIGFTLEAAEEREDAGERVHFDLRGIEGKKGLEGIYDKLLRGQPGSELIQIDVSGFRHRDLQVNPPQPGGNLELTLDAQIQRFAAEALATRQDGEAPGPVRGAVVVLDPNNGDVLAMVSSPSFDPNIYMQSKAYRQSLLKDPLARTYQRAVFGQYPPGSTFKPIVALGALKTNPEFSEIMFDCHNPYYVDSERNRWRKKCWIHKQYGEHGEITLREALMLSCNVYMYELSKAIGYEPIHEMASAFGMGQYVGLFPDLEERPEQKSDKYGNLPTQSNNVIDLCNMSIGQGAILASPLQMAMVAATIANGGTLYRPRLVKKWSYHPEGEPRENPTWAIRRIDVPVDALELVRGGMHDVVMHENGTAKQARVNGIEIAGKTGSAQYRKKVDGEVVNSTHTWMISYAPYDFPRYAVAMLVEDGVSGGRSIGPRLSQLYTKIFEYDGTIAKEEG